MAKNEALKLDDSVKQNSKGQVILGRLTGPCADFIHPTRNGRKYDESLWEKVFNDSIVNEYFEAGGIPGELDHPTDRLETCSEKIAIMMPDKPTKDNNGNLIASFDILDTPNGRIAYTLAKYGYKLGISSRGGGDTYTGADGEEHVDEDTYDFHGFDLVLLPAVKSARLQLQESLQNGKTFKQAINESLEKATPDEKKVMTETLNNLNINYADDINEKKHQIKIKLDSLQDTLDWALEKGYSHRIKSILDQIDELSNKLKDIEYTSEKSIDKKDEAVDNAEANVINQLQESLLANQTLETKITELQEKLSVCYAKEAKYEEDINKYKSAIQNLSSQAKNAKALQSKVSILEEELKSKDNIIKESKDRDHKINNINLTKQKSLTETLNTKTLELTKANSQIKNLQENLRKQENEAKVKINSLQEELSEQKKNLSIKTSEYSNKLSNANKLVEQYRQTAKTAVNKYIESQATRLGVKSKDILDRLPSNYSFKDIDTICEDLSEFKLKVSNLPFNVEKSKLTIKESKETSKLRAKAGLDDDTVDDSLLTLAGLKK